MGDLTIGCVRNGAKKRQFSLDFETGYGRLHLNRGCFIIKKESKVFESNVVKARSSITLHNYEIRKGMDNL